MNKLQIESNTQIASVEPAQSTPINPPNFPALLLNGGVAVAVIIALTYYNKVLLKLVTKLVKANRKNK